MRQSFMTIVGGGIAGPSGGPAGRRRPERSRQADGRCSRTARSKRSCTSPRWLSLASRSRSRTCTIATMSLGSFQLLEAMRQAGVWRIVFSSTTATYGTPEKMPIAETTPQQPINPYGFSKLVVEHMLDDYAAAYGFGFAALRISTRPARRGRQDRRRPHARIALDSDRAAGRSWPAAIDQHFRRRLSDPRRNMHPRLCACRRSGQRLTWRRSSGSSRANRSK